MADARHGLETEESSKAEYEKLVTGRPMPRLSLSDSILSYYRFHFTDDGYPAQRHATISGQLFEHPILPIYVIDNWFRNYRKSKDQAYVDGVCAVADAVLRRMSPREDALIFVYPGDLSVARAVRPYISGLTQAYYIQAFEQAFSLTGEERFQDAAEGAVNSLTIPAEQGGVARYLNGGAGIEEVPLDVPELILNGWLSALVTYLRRKTLSDNSRHRAFAADNISLLKTLLSRYDIPELLNTRYSLATPLQINVQTTQDLPVHINSFGFKGDTRVFTATLAKAGGYTNAILDKDVQRVSDGCCAVFGNFRASLVLSQCFDSLQLKLDAEFSEDCEVEFSVLVANHSVATGEAEREWVSLGKAHASEAQQIVVDIPENVLRQIGTPTNFDKIIGGQRRNVYHVIHANRLLQLHQLTGEPLFLSYAHKWADYVRKWPTSSPYRDLTTADHSLNLRKELR